MGVKMVPQSAEDSWLYNFIITSNPTIDKDFIYPEFIAKYKLTSPKELEEIIKAYNEFDMKYVSLAIFQQNSDLFQS
jgi:hypothetical protein